MLRRILVLLLGLTGAMASSAPPPGAWTARVAAGEKGEVSAQLSLGYAYALGEGVARDLPAAIKWYRLAAKQGDRSACFNLGMIYRFGLVPVDDASVAELYQEAAQRGEASAQYKLGLARSFLDVSFELDAGAHPSQAQGGALGWLQKAAAQGQPDAQLLLGDWCARGVNGEKDPVKACQYFKQAAAQQNAEAQYRLARACLSGEGTLKSEGTAAKWLRLAAEAGHRKAQLEWGNALAAGRGVAANEKEAEKWWRLADEPAPPQPYRTVDEFFEQASKPAPRDVVQAHAWFNLAASRNYRRGSGEMTPQIVLSLVEQEMTDQQKQQAEVEAERLVGELR